MNTQALRRMRTACFLLLAFWGTQAAAQRREISLNPNWKFRFSHQVQKGSEIRVNLPHTWNAQDALSGKIDYKRGIGNYEKSLYIDPAWEGKRLFLRFEGVANVANVFLNRKHLGEHRGGYGAFLFEITDLVDYGKENSILVRASNAEQLDLMPLVGDFNFYGGIYRKVELLITNDLCISPLDHASSGIRLVQEEVSAQKAKVRALVELSNARAQACDARLTLRLWDGNQLVKEVPQDLRVPTAQSTHELAFELENPHLWDGRHDPFRYRAELSLSQGEEVLDCVNQPLGLRFFRIDPQEGFFLNGRHLPLRGVCRHQDRHEVGNALRPVHHQEDAALMVEMGANAVRLSHYPQDPYFYELMDQYGLVVWTEIPFVGPGGYEDKGFVNQPSFRQNGKEQLIELIRQHYNHPSICMWGLFNELNSYGDNPLDYIQELNALAHAEDPTRPTTAASNQTDPINFVSDLIAWNKYDGWYGSTPATLATWLDLTHTQHPELCIGLSEYGAGASIYHQQDSLKQSVPTAYWHPENWQTYYHIQNWKIIKDRPYVWGSFIWNMFDFGAAHRTEGDRPGINDKGLVTLDRKVRKDAFYFYKANWNKEEPFVYLAQKRCTLRQKPQQNFQVFTNLTEAELFVNGQSCGKRKADELCTLTWENIPLQKGLNEVKVVAGQKKALYTDSFTCTLE